MAERGRYLRRSARATIAHDPRAQGRKSTRCIWPAVQAHQARHGSYVSNEPDAGTDTRPSAAGRRRPGARVAERPGAGRAARSGFLMPWPAFSQWTDEDMQRCSCTCVNGPVVPSHPETGRAAFTDAAAYEEDYGAPTTRQDDSGVHGSGAGSGSPIREPRTRTSTQNQEP